MSGLLQLKYQDWGFIFIKEIFRIIFVIVRLYPHSSSSKAQSPGPVAATWTKSSELLQKRKSTPISNLRCSRTDPWGDRDVIDGNVSKSVSSNDAFENNPERFRGRDRSLAHVPWIRSVISDLILIYDIDKVISDLKYLKLQESYQLFPASPVKPQILTSPDWAPRTKTFKLRRKI